MWRTGYVLYRALVAKVILQKKSRVACIQIVKFNNYMYMYVCFAKFGEGYIISGCKQSDKDTTTLVTCTLPLQ